MRLVRKINVAYWGDIDAHTAVPADAVTLCLRTYKNTLSVWEINSDDEFLDAVLAIVSTFTRPDTVSFVSIDSNKLLKGGVPIEKTPAPTKYAAFADRHRDLSNLNFYTLGEVVDAIKTELNENRVHLIKWKKLKALLLEAIKNGKIAEADLDAGLADELKK